MQWPHQSHRCLAVIRHSGAVASLALQAFAWLHPLQGLFSSAEGSPSFFFAPLLAVGAVVGAHFSTRSVITDIAEGSAVGLRSAPPGTLPMPRKYGPPTPLSEWSRPASGDPRLTSWDGYTHSSRIAAVFCNARVVTRVLSTKGRAIARLSASRRRPTPVRRIPSADVADHPRRSPRRIQARRRGGGRQAAGAR